jgi:hypothetical protein
VKENTRQIMDYRQSCVYAKDVAKYYIKRMPVKNDYLYKRTSSLFLHILFDEIELYYVKRNQSSLSATTEYGISLLVCNIYTDFIRPMYFSLFLHDKAVENNATELSYCVSKPKKRVRINTSMNRVHIISTKKK